MAQPQIRLPILSSTICLPGQHADHAGHLHRLGSMSMLLTLAWAWGLRMKWAWVMPRRLDVIDVTALAGDETSVFLAHDPCADTFDSHDVVSNCVARCAPLARLAMIRLVANCRRCLGAERYSAACATFIRPAASSTDLTML